MAKSTISITFKLNGDGKGFKDLAKDAEGFKKVVRETISEAQQLNAKTINFAAIAVGIDQAQQSIAQLHSTLKGLTDAYAIQVEAETKLQTVMKQRMGSTDAEIESIKKLTAAQQQLGIIGDEVQLQGAQQIATFLNEKKSLEVLIPAMNNLLAQQKGMNATGSDAVTIGNLIGKAMQGQTSALRRVGITFSEAEEQVMKFGNEGERAAMMAQIITNNVGNMNAELAKTDAGKQKQLENTIGDLKEKLGSLAQGAMPFLTIASNTTIALAGVLKLTAGVKAATAAVTLWATKGKLAALTMTALGLKTTQTAAVMRVFSAAMSGTAYTATALKIALRGLLIATGVGAVIAGLTMVVEGLMNASEKASDSLDGMGDAQERARLKAEQAQEAYKAEQETLSQTRSALDLNIKKLKEFKGTKEQEKKIVTEMNTTYGATMGYFSSVSAWYEALTKNSKTYCRQMVLEAKARRLANQIAEKDAETHNLIYDEKGGKKKYSTKRDTRRTTIVDPNDLTGGSTKVVTSEVAGSSELEKVTRQIANNKAEVKELNRLLSATVAESSKLQFDVKGAAEMPTFKETTKIEKPKKEKPQKTEKEKEQKEEKTRLQELNALIDEQTEKYIKASEAERKDIAAKIASYKAERDGIEATKRELDRPASLNTLKDIDAEIQYQQSLREKATADELTSIQATINALNKKREAMTMGESLLASKEEAKSLKANSLSFEELTNRIDDLQKKLSNTDLTSNQRKDIQSLIDTYRNLRKETAYSYETLRSGWDSLKGIGGGIDGITSALEGNGNAWQVLTAMVDSALSIYEGVMGIVGIIDMLTAATTATTVAKTAETAATGTAAGAAVAEAATQEAVAVATIPTIIANKAATASYMELASAMYFAAHAAIPFVGFGLAAGFTASAVAMTQAVGVTPFAHGGLVSGPTYALIGEYAGASNNPEVVAPLDKLRSMINPQGGVAKIDLRVRGRELVGVMANDTRLTAKSGKRTYIKG